jgi:hypothetical protein
MYVIINNEAKTLVFGFLVPGTDILTETKGMLL